MARKFDEKIQTKQHELEQVIGLIEGSACLLNLENTILFSNHVLTGQEKFQVAGGSNALQAQPGSLRNPLTPASCQFKAGCTNGKTENGKAEYIDVTDIGGFQICRACNTSNGMEPGQAELYKS